jgi:uncharacterized protein YjdB
MTSGGNALPRLRRHAVALGGAAALALAAAGCQQKPASIDVQPAQLRLHSAGPGRDIHATVLDRKGRAIDGVALAWSSSDRKIADVSPQGHVLAKSPGNATILVAAGSIQASVPVEVSPLARVELVPPVLHLVGPKGGSARLDALGETEQGAPAPLPALKWTSSNPAVAEVASDGTVTAVGPGKTEITITTGDLSTSSEIDVEIREISRIAIHPETAILRAGDSQKFTVLAFDEKGLPIGDAAGVFATSNAAILKISGSGSSTALAPGTATVTVAIGEHRAQAIVLVSPAR